MSWIQDLMNGQPQTPEDNIVNGYKLIPENVLDYEESQMEIALSRAKSDDLALIKLEDLPAKKLFKQTPMKDQGTMGSCTAFGGCKWFEEYYLDKKEEVLDLSELMIYHLNKLNDPWDGVWYSGSSTKASAKMFKEYGSCPESVYPYRKIEFDTVTKEAFRKAWKYRISGWSYVEKSELHLVNTLQDSPILIGFKFFKQFMEPGN